MIAPLPPDEKERLEALRRYEMLDSAPEQDFDDITLLAAHICGTPIATITLVDESRQWFKSRIGVPGCETSREIAFCAHTILQKEVMVVTDAQADGRFAANPLVTGDPEIRFYAGAPLITPDGYVLGTLCVIDRVPRELSAEKKTALQALSRQVVAQLELRRSLRELRQSERRSGGALAEVVRTRELYASLVNSMDGIVWKADAASFQFTFVSKRAEHVLGFPAEQWLSITDFWVNRIHPSDREQAVNIRVTSKGKKENYTFEYRMLAADGDIVWMRDIVTYVEEPGKPPELCGIMLDITSSKRTEESLRLLGAAVEQARESILITDADLDLPGPRIVFVNPAFTKMTGYTAEEAVGKTPRILQGPRTDEMVLSRLRKNLERGEEFAGESINYRKDGSAFDLEWQIAPIRDPSGKTTHFVAIERDITERKRAENAVHESQRFAESIAENSTSIIYIFDLETRRNIYANRSLAETLGYSSAQISEMGDKFLPSIIHPEDLPRIVQHDGLFAELEDRGVLEIEYRTKHVSGEWRWIWDRQTVFKRRPNGAAWQMMGTGQDITERKRVEAALRESEERFSDAFEHAPIGVALVSLDGRWLKVNHGVCDMLGYSAAELLTRTYQETIPPEDIEISRENARRLIAGEIRSTQAEMRYVQPGGDIFTVLVSSALVRGSDGPPRYFIAHFQDITEGKRAKLEIERLNADLEQRVARRTQALLAATQEAEHANAAKNDFLSRMSHELRTPLNAILGFGQLLERDGRDPEEADNIAQILKAGRHLLELVDEVLDISDIEAGNLDLEPEICHLGEAIEEVLALARPLAACREVALGGLMCERRVLIDRGRFKQVVSNLLSNAISYNRQGGSVTLDAQDTAEGWLRLAVTDDGPGIAAEDVSKVFNTFERLGVAGTVDGIGLGLAISKQLIELMGCRIGVKSVLGAGSTFWIELPVA